MYKASTVLLTCLLSLLLCPLTMMGQSVFTKTYKGRMLGRTIEMYENQLMIAGKVPGMGGGDFVIARLDTMGQVIRSLALRAHGENELRYMRPHPEGGFVFLGESVYQQGQADSSEIVVIRIGEQGTLRWARAFRTQDDRGGVSSGLAVDSAGNIAFAALTCAPNASSTQPNYQATLVLLDSLGNKKWERHHLLNNTNVAGDIVNIKSNLHFTADGDMLAGWNYRISGVAGIDYGFAITSWDTTGVNQWAKDFPHRRLFSMDRRRGDNSLVLYLQDSTNHMVFARLDSVGDVLWARQDINLPNSAIVRPISIKLRAGGMAFLRQNNLTTWEFDPNPSPEILKTRSSNIIVRDFVHRGNTAYLISYRTTQSYDFARPYITKAYVEPVANCFMQHLQPSVSDYAPTTLPSANFPLLMATNASLQDSAYHLTPEVLLADDSTICQGDGLVWPGDANSDGIANVIDIIYLGLGWGKSGPARVNPTIQWTGQFALDWNTFFFNGANMKHADGNGDGHINRLDLFPILLNYGSMHNKTDQNGAITDPPIYLEMPADSLPTGQLISIPVFLGDSARPVMDLLGMGFKVRYHTALVDSGTMTFTPDVNWMGIDSVDIMMIEKDLPFNGELEIGLTKIDQLAVSGYGRIGTLSFVTIDDIAGKDFIAEKLKLEILPLGGINFEEEPLDFHGCPDSLVVFQNTATSLPELISHEQISLYPNPTQGALMIQGQNLQIERIEIYDMMGRMLESFPVNAPQTTLNLHPMAPAVYLIKGYTSEGLFVRKIQLVQPE
ncbi:MAG: T9SS type A sorting domain-containing protein [Bacteroidota bacterium]